ncbi:hypothetical protein C8J56DRAFT_886365 [Mycena floridula]|nr:hypothetical protein C8J56DRAFT_886365 [Mycena floridula]
MSILPVGVTFVVLSATPIRTNCFWRAVHLSRQTGEKSSVRHESATAGWEEELFGKSPSPQLSSNGKHRSATPDWEKELFGSSPTPPPKQYGSSAGERSNGKHPSVTAGNRDSSPPRQKPGPPSRPVGEGSSSKHRSLTPQISSQTLQRESASTSSSSSKPIPPQKAPKATKVHSRWSAPKG